MAGAIELRLFGAPQISCGDAGVAFARERRFQLLAYLAARADWVTRDQLAELLFPDRDNAAARSNLRKVLHGARRFVWAADLETRGELVRWPVASDLRRFEQALAEGRSADAVDLYLGAFGLGLDDAGCAPFTQWLEFERNRAATRWRGAAIGLLQTMRPAAVVALTDRLLAADPYDDEALRARLEALAALGRLLEAQRAFRDFSERLAEDLGIEPSAATRALATRIATPAVTPRRGASPEPADDLVGRETELGDLTALLAEEDTRLVTITGAGGVGKTRLARSAFQSGAAARFGADAFWIEVEDLTSIDGLAARLADAVGLAPQRGDLIEQLVRSLRGRSALFVLDNCEHLVAGATGGAFEAFVTTLLTGCERVVLLVTSRSRLHLAQERLLPLAGLAHEAAGRGDAVLALPAARLFVARAQRVLPRFDPGASANAIAAICRLTEGLPLALELAAAWVHIMPCTEIAADLQGRIEVGEAQGPGSRGLRATFERSWQLATPGERDTLARLSVIRGRFTREAARAIAQASLPVLAALVDKSLVAADGDTGRFSLHPLLRAFAADKLAAIPEAAALARAEHAGYFRQFVAQFRDFETTDQKHALSVLADELENVGSAWRWACERRDADFIAASVTTLRNFFANKGRFEEGLRWFGQAQTALAPLGREADPARCELGCAMGVLLRHNGEYAGAEEVARKTLPLARALRRRGLIKACLNTVGICTWIRGQHGEAARYYIAGLRLAQADRDAADIAVFSNNLGIIDAIRGDERAAESHWLRALDAERELGNQRGCVSVLMNLGNLQRLSHRFERAVASASEALRLCDLHGFDSMRCPVLLGLAATYIDGADLDTARETLRQALAALDASQKQYEAMAYQTSARLATLTGEVDAARNWLERGLRAAVQRGQVPAQLSIIGSYAELFAAAGDPLRAAAMWSFAIAHSQTEAFERRRMESLAAALPLDSATRQAVEHEVRPWRLESVCAQILAGFANPSNGGGGPGSVARNALAESASGLPNPTRNARETPAV